MEKGYIYLIHVREFKNSQQQIYKIGKTTQSNLNRFKTYPKDSELLFYMCCDDCHKAEKEVIREFKKNFIQKKDIGTEYFEGDLKEMMKDIFKIITDTKEKEEKETKTTEEKIEEEMDEATEEKIEEMEEATEEETKEESEESEEELEEEINTYEDFKKFSDIYKIIITNKKTKEGYFRYENNCWRKLYNKYSVEGENRETFDDLDKFYCQKMAYKIIKPEMSEIIDENEFRNNYTFYVNKINKKDINYEEFINLTYEEKDLYSYKTKYKYKFVDLNYNYNKIKEDIIKKCYNNEIKIYNLKYNEYEVNINYGTKTETKIYNSKENKFDEIENYDKQGIIIQNNPYGTFKLFYVSNKIETEIVENILKSLIRDENILKKYNEICYSIFVKENSSVNIFYDYYDNVRQPYLSIWLRDLYVSLTEEEYITSTKYYGDLKKYNSIIKKKTPRFVIINDNSISYDKMINHFVSNGIKNIIIVIRDKTKNIYDEKNYIDFLESNKKMIKEQLIMKDQIEKIFRHYEDIFFCGDLLAMNFFKWCCTEKNHGY